MVRARIELGRCLTSAGRHVQGERKMSRKDVPSPTPDIRVCSLKWSLLMKTWRSDADFSDKQAAQLASSSSSSSQREQLEQQQQPCVAANNSSSIDASTSSTMPPGYTHSSIPLSDRMWHAPVARTGRIVQPLGENATDGPPWEFEFSKV